MINPLTGGVTKCLFSFILFVFPPIFTVLRALSPEKYHFREFNRRFWQNRYYRSNKLVAITCFTSNCYEAYKIAKEFKKRGSTVIMGGPHVTYMPNEALDFCDSVVIGEAEGVWHEVIQDYEHNSLKPKYTGAAKEDFHKEVHDQLMKSPPYVVKEFLEPTRGCKFRCHFCTIPMLTGGRVRKKPIPEMVALLKKVAPTASYVSLLDNNIYNDPEYSKNFFKALKPLKVKWMSFCTIDIAKNKEALRLAKESGCFMFVFGYEIFGGSLENQQGGKFAMADRYVRYSKAVKKAGIRIRGNFVLGWDSDNWKSLLQLWKFSFSIRPLFAVVGLLTPLPGSRLYYDMLRQDRLTNLNWREYDALNLVHEHPDRAITFFSKFFYPLVPLFYFCTTSVAGWIILGLLIWNCIAFTPILPWSLDLISKL